jgi:hypothetical protein
MPSTDLTDFIVTLLHQTVGPCHCHRGGRRHHRQVHAPSASTHPSGGNTGAGPSGTAAQPSVPSLDQLEYPPMEPSDNNASLRGRRGLLCAIHGWGPCPHPVAPAVTSSSWGHEGEEEGREEEDSMEMMAVLVLLHRLLTHRTVRKMTRSMGGPRRTLAASTLATSIAS